MMRFQTIEAPFILNEYIRSYWHLSGHCTTPLMNRVFPDGYTDILLNFGDPLLQQRGTREVVDRSTSFVSGIMTAPAQVGLSGQVDLLGISMQPGAAETVLGLPIHELADSRAELDSVWGKCVIQLEEALFPLPGLQERVQYLNRWFSSKISGYHAPDPMVRYTLKQLHKTSGIVDIGFLHSLSGRSPRQQQRLFRTQVGLSPKKYARVIRFKKAMRILEEGRLSLSEIALQLGFSDQAHLGREMKEFSGLTPGELLGKSRDAILYSEDIRRQGKH